MPRFNILSAILSEMLIQIGRYIRVIQNIQMGCFFGNMVLAEVQQL